MEPRILKIPTARVVWIASRYNFHVLEYTAYLLERRVTTLIDVYFCVRKYILGRDVNIFGGGFSGLGTIVMHETSVFLNDFPCNLLITIVLCHII